jgi:uncharacterized protein (TIGR02996 family)
MTSERAALIAAIRAAPDEDAPRLIFADWLDEQGSEANAARAEFIRLQIARANLPPDDPQHSPMQARELRLLKRYGPAWCGSHFLFRKVRFRRGFIEYVHLHLQHFQHHRRQILALEPIRDVRLTGWHRAPIDLICRVAACPEWQFIETLRIHHQGPGKHPRNELVLLLESPHLTGLRALHCPRVDFDPDGRRRFERLAVLRQLRELRLPGLAPWPRDPGRWFSEGGLASAAGWTELRSFTVPGALDVALLRELTGLPFWAQLTSLGLRLTNREELAVHAERLPRALAELFLSTSDNPAEFRGADAFVARLAEAPLRCLHLSVPARILPLERLLSGPRAWRLQSLRLEMCDIARRAGTRYSYAVHSPRLGAEAAGVLAASEHLRSLVHLDLAGVRLSDEGAHALAAAQGWDRLRSLEVTGAGLTPQGVAVLLTAPLARNLVCLAIGADARRDALDVSPDLAAVLTDPGRLPHLASLRLAAAHWHSPGQAILAGSDSLAWLALSSLEYNVPLFRASGSPERCPPLDLDG